MKLTGIFGKGTGRKGDAVFAVSGGVQIVRQYNPNVSNPNSDAQVEQRAKLKLMSQLAASLSRGIAIPKKGLISARNQFVSKNIGLCTFEDGMAVVDMAPLQLTIGSTPIPVPSVDRETGVALSAAVAGSFDKVFYVCVEITEDNKARIFDIQEADPGVSNTFPAEMTLPEGAGFLYAYGAKFSSAQAKALYENYEIPNTNDVAQLSALKSTLLANAVLSATSGVEFEANK